MNLLLILILVQLAGILLSGICNYFVQRAEHKRVMVARFYSCYTKNENDEWTWLMDYLQAYPDSSLKSLFPSSYKVAMATRKYKELNQMRKRGKISEREYEKKLRKILPLIDIREDLAVERNS
jgi:hypothetical protein